MRRVLYTTLFSVLSFLPLAALPGEAAVITVEWSGPSKEAWDAAKAAFPGMVEDTESYRGCFVVLGPYCHYVWNQGLAAGGELPELFVDDFGRPGFGLNYFQSSNFSIFADCKPDQFDPCYSTFTPMRIDWDFYGGSGNLAPFVWESSKGGTLIVGGDWDGRFLGPQWQNVQWISGTYGCRYLDDPDLFCTDDFSNPFIRGMTIQVPEPSMLVLWSVTLATAYRRKRVNGRR